MKRNAKQSSRGSGSGSRLRLAVLAATVAAFFLVPAVAQAATGVEPVKVNINGTGAGNVHVPLISFYKGSPEIECTYASPGPATGVCETFMSNEGAGFEQVIITGKAAPGSRFSGWEVKNTEFEACAPTGSFPGESESQCAPFVEPEETGSGEAEVTATFVKAFTVNKVGQGTVVGANSGIVCTPSETSCSAVYTGPETLTASPAAGYAFASWKGCTSHVGLTCTVASATAATTVTATFTPAPQITIEKPNGAGSGKVKAVLSCELDCSGGNAPAKPGALVKVTATPGLGYQAVSLAGSTGSASGCTTSPCEFTMGTEATKVKATFATIQKANLTVKVVGPAANKGKVSTSPKGISCTAGPCSVTNAFPKATPVILTVTPPAVGYTFAGWKESVGTCTGTTSPCEVSLSGGEKTVEAEFK